MTGRTYTIPEHVWRECICIIRDYDRARAEYESLQDLSPSPLTGQPKARSPSSPTERAAIKCALMSIRLNAVDEAFGRVPEEYRQAIRDNIVKRLEYPDYAHRNTYGYWKRKVVKHLAEKLLLM
jgi:hypothetical protein